MAAIALTGDDSLNLMGHEFSEFASGNWFEMNPLTDAWSLSMGMGGNIHANYNIEGEIWGGMLRIIRGGNDDKFLNSYLQSSRINPIGMVMLAGVLTKRIGHGTGKISYERWVLKNGVYQRHVGITSAASGDAEVALTQYSFIFPAPIRAI